MFDAYHDNYCLKSNQLIENGIMQEAFLVASLYKVEISN